MPFLRDEDCGGVEDVRFAGQKILTLRPVVAPWQKCINGATGGEGRNRTRSSPTASLNILIYKGILTLILWGFKRFLSLSAHYRT